MKDPTLPFYMEIEKCSVTYAFRYVIGGGYGHKFNYSKLPELLEFDTKVILDGVFEGSRSAIYLRFG